MRRIIFFIIMIVAIGSTLTCVAQHTSTPAAQSDIERMQAIVVRALNRISIPEKSAELDQISITELTIDTINTIVGTPNNIRLAKNIKGLKPTEGSSLEEAQEYFSKEIFSEEKLLIFFDRPNRTASVEDCQQLINAQIGELIAEVEMDNLPTEPIAKTIESKTLPSEAMVKGANKDHDTSDGNPFTKFVWILVFLALGILCLLLWRRMQEANKRIVKMDRQLQELNKLLLDKDSQISSLRRDRENLSMRLEERRQVDNYYSQANSNPLGCPPAVPDGYGYSTSQEEISLNPQNYYAVNSESGIFSNLSLGYRRGQYLYEITTLDGQTGTYHFINDSENVEIAKMSRSNFLEQACDIVNDDQRSFSAVVTERPGEVIKENSVWRIVSKAIVRLS